MRALIVSAFFFVPLASAQAQLRQYLPPEADFVIEIEHPRKLYAAVAGHDVVKKLQTLQPVREAYETTNYRRLLQLIAYFEKELDVSGPELLDRLAGGGIVVAGRFQDPPALLAIVQARDAKSLERFVDRAVDLVDKELARQESKQKVERQQIAGLEGFKIDKAYLARKDNLLFLASHPIVIQTALDAQRGKNLAEPLAKSRGQLPPGALAWAWLNLEAARKTSGFKDGLAAVSMDPNALFIFGGLVSVLQRAPHLLVGLDYDGNNVALVHRLAAGRDGMQARANLFLPADDKGSLPLLEPPGTLASISYFLDLKELWQKRAELFSAQQVKSIEEADQKSGPFLGGTKISTLLEKAGRYQRVVVAQPHKSPYKIKPDTPIPAFAVVLDTRDPAFAKSMNTVLRAAALLGSFTLNLKMVEEKHAGQDLVAYYFDENKPLPNDAKNVRLNFSPCFAAVGDQFIISSTNELARHLIDLVAHEKRDQYSPASTRIKLSSAGAAQAMRAGEDQILAQVVLNQALPPATARKQVDELIRLVQGLGSVLFEVRYAAKEFQYDVRWQYPK